jgi:hypothetical protein
MKHFIKRWRALLVMIAASNAVLELLIHIGMFKKWCYCVPPIYDEEQEDHEGLHQVVGCHDATPGDFCGHLVAHHDLTLFDATPFQVVSHDVDGSRQRGNSFDYDCCNQYGHGKIDSYGVLKRWCYCIPLVYDEEIDDLQVKHI